MQFIVSHLQEGLAVANCNDGALFGGYCQFSVHLQPLFQMHELVYD